MTPSPATMGFVNLGDFHLGSCFKLSLEKQWKCSLRAAPEEAQRCGMV